MALSLGLAGELEAQTRLKVPVCPKKPEKITWHGDTRVDNYYWLNQYWLKGPDSSKVVDYLNRENKYTERLMAHTEPLQKKLYDELIARIKQNDESVPYTDNGYSYYTRFTEGKEYPVFCRKKIGQGSAEEVMLDVNEMAKGYNYYQIGAMQVSADNKMLVFAVDTLSRRNYDIRIKNLETGEFYPDMIPETTGNCEWAADNKTIFYSRKNPVTLRSEKIFRHRIGEDPSKDKEIYFEKDETFGVFVGKTKSKKYLTITSGSTLSSEVRLLEADNPDGEFRIFQPREKDHLYSVDHYKDRFFVTTNWKAKNFRLMETSLTQTAKENWREKIAHRADVLLEGTDVFRDHLVVAERSNAQQSLRIIRLSDGKEHYLKFDEPVYTAGMGSNVDFESDVLRYNYQSLTTPASVIDYNMLTGEKTVRKEQEVGGGFDKKNYVSERLWVTARDGAKVPVSIVYRKGFKKDGKAPVLLYAYGSYGITMDPAFNSSRLSLLDRGFAYAIAHVRGGQEMGRQWYEDGKMFKKKNTFNDFIDCAEYLIKGKYTSRDHLYAMGGSAGGLLMGAVVNMRPDLWKGVIAAVPFVDVVTTMLDESIPLTTGEFDEWGNPKNKDSYTYMKSYSPYDNVEKKNYPNMLVTTGLHDSQVQYFEPAKWVAKLREMKTDKNRLLLHTDMSAGHGGTSGRFRRLKQTALEYSFLLDLEGKKN